MTSSYEQSPSELFNRLGSLLDGYLKAAAERPVVRFRKPEELPFAGGWEPPRDGTSDEALWERFQGLLDDGICLHPPMYMGHQVAPPFPPAAATAGFTQFVNPGMAAWEMSPVGSLIERQTIGWMAGLAGLPEGSAMDALFRADAPYVFGSLEGIGPDLNIGERNFQCSRG